MFDHLGIVTDDLGRGGVFYDAVVETLGLKPLETHRRDGGTGWLVYGTVLPASPFFVLAAGRPIFWEETHGAGLSPVHIAFRAPSPTAVDRVHAVGLQHGARNNGDPGIRRPPYYCAYLIDADGNDIEASLYLSAAEVEAKP